MEFSKSVIDDEENNAKDVTDSHFSMEERNKRSNKTFENSVTDIDKHGQQSRITNDFRDPYDGHEVQSSGMDSSKCVAKELDQIPNSSNNTNLNYIDVCKKHRELPNLSASNLNTIIDSRESSTLSSVGFKREGFSILDLNTMANDTKQFSFSFHSRFSSVIGNMPEIPCNKMKISSEKAQSSKSEFRKHVRKSPEQVAILERYYLIDNDPGTYELERIATETKLKVSSVYVWFKIKRLKERGIGNMPEMPCDKMKASSEKIQGSKSESRKYVRKSPIQVAILEKYYLADNYPGRNDLECIATETKLDVSSVNMWFNMKRYKEREKEQLKLKNVVHLSKGEQSSDVQKVSTPIINDESNRQFQVNPRNTTELGNRTKGNSNTCTVENVTAQQNTDKCDNNPKEGLKIDEHIAASSSTAEIVTTEENYLSRSPLREKLCTDKECPLNLSMPKKSENEI